MNVIGLDLSSTCTGICLPDGTTEHFQPPKNLDLYGKARATHFWLLDWLLPAEMVVVEAIGTQFVRTAISMAYMHCMFDGIVYDAPSTRVVKVSPAELKKFATGKGNATKHDMTVAAIRNGWKCDGDTGSTDDEADAWWLWALGKTLVGEWVIPVPVYRADVVRKINGRVEAA